MWQNYSFLFYFYSECKLFDLLFKVNKLFDPGIKPHSYKCLYEKKEKKEKRRKKKKREDIHFNGEYYYKRICPKLFYMW